MKNISKGSISIYLFNAYSNLNPNVNYITGSDRVGLKLIENDPNNIVVVAPYIFKKNLPNNIKFISTDNFKFRNLYLRYIFRTINTIRYLWKERIKNQNSSIISTSDFLPDVIPSFLFSNYMKWYAFTYHLYPLSLNLRNLFGIFLQSISYLLFLKAYKVLTTSSECENFLKKNFRITNTSIISLGIDLDLYKNSYSKNKELVYLGRIKKSKGVYDLPEIIFNVKKQIPDIKLNIIGNGDSSEISLLESKINYFKVGNNIKILYSLEDSQVRELLLKSKILLQPSYEEGFGLSILEALASKMQIVAYNLPVYEEHFKEFSINYIELGDKNLFAQKICELYGDDLSFIHFNYDFNKFSWKSIFNKVFND